MPDGTNPAERRIVLTHFRSKYIYLAIVADGRDRYFRDILRKRHGTSSGPSIFDTSEVLGYLDALYQGGAPLVFFSSFGD
jgi:hypothetical protein